MTEIIIDAQKKKNPLQASNLFLLLDLFSHSRLLCFSLYWHKEIIFSRDNSIIFLRSQTQRNDIIYV